MTSGMEVYDSEPEPGQLNIMVLDMDGNNIPSGSGTALEIQFTVSDSIESTIAPLELSNVVLSDEEGNTLYSEYGSGYFFVNGVNALRIGGGTESVSVDLYNAFTVGGVQFTIAFDPGLVILDEINTTPRSNAMDLSYSDIAPGMITVLLYSFNLDSVIDNSGSILSLEFSYLSEYSGTVNLDLSNVAVSNMDGITEEVETFDGELYLMDDEGGDDGPPECVLDCPGIDEAGEPFDPGFCEWFTDIQGDACFDDCNEDIMEELDDLLAECEECLADPENCGGDDNVTVDYNSGWNLVGLPLDVEDSGYSILYPESIEGTLYSFNGGYNPATNLFNGEGYWLRFNESGSTTIYGTPIYELTISLNEGWNLISGLIEDISISSVIDPDGIIIPGTLFGFSGSYVETDVLVPGNGYWLRAYQDGEVTITGDGLARVTPQDFSLSDRANTLTINGMDLYFGVEMLAREKLSYSLPPKPPKGAFDVRFKGDTRVTKESAEIEIMSTTETLTITYNVVIDAGEHMKWVLTSKNGNDYILEGSGEITVSSSEKFILNRESVIPITFALHQNFPNPFNPITTLRYDLPSDALVTLSIYDMLGREITQLVNTNQQAGFKSVQWDATDSMGRPVSAGVYLYQIEAGDFIQTRKMVLLK